MKAMLKTNEKETPGILIDTSLDKYDNIVLFPDKLAKANKNLKKSGFPKLPNNKRSQ